MRLNIELKIVLEIFLGKNIYYFVDKFGRKKVKLNRSKILVEWCRRVFLVNIIVVEREREREYIV